MTDDPQVHFCDMTTLWSLVDIVFVLCNRYQVTINVMATVLFLLCIHSLARIAVYPHARLQDI